MAARDCERNSRQGWGFCARPFSFLTQLFAAANFDPEWGTIRGKVTLAATGLPVHQVHRLLFIGEV
jgi:hypothetical protein